MTKTKRKPQAPVRSTRLVRRCEWMLEKRNWEDCGEPATMMDRVTKLAYCDRHSACLQWMDVEPLPNVPAQRPPATGV